MAFTYLVINKTTGLAYYGVRFAKTADPDTFWKDDKYRTSSKLVKALIKQYGDHDFYTEVRRVFDNSESAIGWESRVNRRLAVPSIKFLNLDACQQPHETIQCKEQCKRITHIESNTCMTVPIRFPLPQGWVQGNKNHKGPRSGRRWYYDPITDKASHINPENIDVTGLIIGKRPNRDSNSAALKAKNLHWFTDGISSKQLDSCPPNWYPGRTKSEKEKLLCATANKKFKGMKWINNNIEQTRISPTENLPTGWKYGRTKY